MPTVLAEESMSIFFNHCDEIARFEACLATEDNRDDRRKAIEEAIKIARELVRRHPSNADAHQCLGLAWYHFPGSSSWRSWHCRLALQRALELEPDHQFALHYLACLNFDQERYEDALELLLDSNFDYFVERDQEWRALKNEELKIVCMLRISPGLFPQAEFDLFTKRFHDALQREARDIKLGSWVWPNELKEYAEWMIVTGATLKDPRVLRILDFCSRIGFKDSILQSYVDYIGG